MRKASSRICRGPKSLEYNLICRKPAVLATEWIGS